MMAMEINTPADVAAPVFFNGVQPDLTPADVAAADAMPERRIVPHGHFNWHHEDLKHVPIGVKNATSDYEDLVTRDKCDNCGMPNPTEIWGYCPGDECYGCEGCKDKPELFVKETGGRNGGKVTYRCCFSGCKAKGHSCAEKPSRNLLAEAQLKKVAIGNAKLSEALRQQGMQDAARRAGEVQEEAAAAGRRRGRANGHSDGKKRKSECTKEEWEAIKEAAKARKLQREQEKAKLALFDRLERQNKFLRVKLSEIDEDLYDELINKFDMQEAAAAAGMEIDDADTDED